MSDADSDFQSGESTERGLARRTVLKAGAVAASVASGFNVFSALGSAHEDETLENTITVQATGGVAAYEFTVSGDVELTANAGKGEDVIRGNTVTGKVGGRGQDTFRFSGHITSFEFTRGEAKVLVNGEVVERLPPTQLPHTITFQAQDSVVDYEFSVSGDVELSTNAGKGEDVVEGKTARGRVGGRGEDTFWFSGDITSLHRGDEPLKVVINYHESEHPDS